MPDGDNAEEDGPGVPDGQCGDDEPDASWEPLEFSKFMCKHNEQVIPFKWGGTLLQFYFCSSDPQYQGSNDTETG